MGSLDISKGPWGTAGEYSVDFLKSILAKDFVYPLLNILDSRLLHKNILIVGLSFYIITYNRIYYVGTSSFLPLTISLYLLTSSQPNPLRIPPEFRWYILIHNRHLVQS